jgi:hypothetical protein
LWNTCVRVGHIQVAGLLIGIAVDELWTFTLAKGHQRSNTVVKRTEKAFIVILTKIK